VLEELAEKLLQFQLAIEFENAVGKCVSQQKLVQMVSADDQSPYELRQPDSFSSPITRDRNEVLLDILLCLLE
jgi:hypothetical protein